jgi:hypothetical protein
MAPDRHPIKYGCCRCCAWGDFLSLRRTLRGGSPDEMIDALGRVELAVAVLVLNGNAGGGHARGEEEEARPAPAAPVGEARACNAVS